MPYHIDWENAEKTIIRQTYTNPLTLGDCYGVIQDNAVMMKSVAHSVDLIIVMDFGFLMVSRFFHAAKYAQDAMPDNQRLLIVVNASERAKMLVNLVKKLAPGATRNLFFANDLNEAYNIIRVSGKNLYS
jgi:hypothetical protein